MRNLNVFFVLLSAVVSFRFVCDAKDPGDKEDHWPSIVEGSGRDADDEDMSDLFADVTSGDFTIHCYKCAGVSHQSGCNVTLLHQNPEEYVTDCNGHCLNISLETSTVFECMEDVPVKKAQCFQKGAMKMCVCDTDLCNGPPKRPRDAVELPASQQGIRIMSHGEIDVMLSETSQRRQRKNGSRVIQMSSTSGAVLVTTGRYVTFLVSAWWFYKLTQDLDIL